MNEELTPIFSFLQSQKIINICTVDENNKPWCFPVYFSVTESFEIFFISPLKTKHYLHIKNNPAVSIATAWNEKNNIWNRKGIQGYGNCQIVKSLKDINLGINSIFQKFPEFKTEVSINLLKNKLLSSKLFKIEIEYLKYWDDELYGDENVEEIYLGDN